MRRNIANIKQIIKAEDDKEMTKNNTKNNTIIETMKVEKLRK
jgi:hypothetical protein